MSRETPFIQRKWPRRIGFVLLTLYLVLSVVEGVTKGGFSASVRHALGAERNAGDEGPDRADPVQTTQT